ncbi:hypothetical protein C7D72_29350, partial [Klebsiella pneumoniae]
LSSIDESLKKQGIAVRWVEFPAGPQMLEGLNVVLYIDRCSDVRSCTSIDGSDVRSCHRSMRA